MTGECQLSSIIVAALPKRPGARLKGARLVMARGRAEKQCADVSQICKVTGRVERSRDEGVARNHRALEVSGKRSEIIERRGE